MKSKYRVVFKMTGGTIVGMKQFSSPAAVAYYVSQFLPHGTAQVCVEDLGTGDIGTYEVKNRLVPQKAMLGLRAFLGI